MSRMTPKYRYVPDTETDRVVALAEATLSRLGVGMAEAPKPEPVEAELVTVAEAASMLRRSSRQIHRYIARGQLAASKPTANGQWLIPREALNALSVKIR